MSRVWWINQSQSYKKESAAGVIYAGYNKEHPARERVEEMRKGDLTVHNAKAHIRALGRVQTDPQRREISFREGPGRVADVEYAELHEPLYFRDVAEALHRLDIPDGPISQFHTGKYGIRQGYCYGFSHQALNIVRQHASHWPDWTEARFPTDPQVAVDTPADRENQKGSTVPDRNEYTISRIVRDSQLAQTVKEKNDYTCQCCGAQPIDLPDGTVYAEAHHLHPLGKGGPDEEENIVCVCPTCHVKLDYGVLKLDHDLITSSRRSDVGIKFVDYHNRKVASQPRQL